MQEKISLTINRELMDKFRKYCKNRAYKISTRVALLIEKDMKENAFNFEKL